MKKKPREEESKYKKKLISMVQMDGASKFIRGDAIAGIIITLVNIIGGIAIGIFQHSMDLKSALQTFTILTVGDGLVSQIPSLITSTAAGLMVTRAVAKENLGVEIVKELTSFPKALYMASAALFIMGIVPGMPTIPFFLLGALLAITGYIMQSSMKEKQKIEEEEKAKEMIKEASKEEEEPEELITQPETITFEIGYGLIPLVDESQDGQIIKRIKSLRKQLSKELGIIIPLIHIKDNLELKPGEYRILIRDVEVAKSEVMPDHLLAIDTGNTKGQIEGVKTKEPAFGLDAYWIKPELKDRAKMLGYTVVDIPTVIITHMSEVIKNHAYEILGRAETKEIVDTVAKKYPIIKEIVPEQVPLNILHRVLQNLLKEAVPIRDILTIVETLSDNIIKTNDPDILTEFVRQGLKKIITSKYAKDNNLYAVVLSPETENYILQKIKEADGELPPLDPGFVQKLITKLSKSAEKFIMNQATPVLLTSPAIRRYVKQIIEPYLPNFAVLSYSDIDSKIKLNILESIDANE
ncbi:flagellar biosynthesis protein FlhA [Hydrogenivirga sp. 128-5-R1-1]|uniref:flagellar biosynthesis protein FlhA n=1 Tax=Hydrogenivirga sp. 128-5-R1-1 TaxID=392423 RepID=UPI00210113A2|nr:flagellar biosynthesis protein FlhA [Hydrogenivirga sp. 128-5-R1-1]